MRDRRPWAHAALVAAVGSSFIVLAGSAMADPRTCQITEVAGVATLTHDGVPGAATVGADLATADQLTTGPSGRVEVACSDQTHVTVGPDTDINLGSLIGEEGDDASIGMSLHRGIARFLAPVRTWGTFNVFGPVAVASVRSTEWIMDTPKHGTNVFVLQGVVEVQSKRGQAVRLQPSYGVDVAPDGTMAAPKVWGAKRVAEVKQRLGLQ